MLKKLRPTTISSFSTPVVCLQMMYRASLLVVLIFGSFTLFAQQTFTISGTIRDQRETLPGAGVYISGYKIATVTNNDGKFTIANLRPGSYDLMVQMIGYLPFSKNIIVSDRSVQVDFTLKPNTVMLNEVVIKADPNRAKYIAQFTSYFIGKSPNSKLCKIINPNVLRVDFDVTKSLLTVKTDDFLIIENRALGYRIKYMLEYFEFNSRTNIIYYSGKPFFEEFKVSKAKAKKYIGLREVAYYGSPQHFFRSLYKGDSESQGFEMHKIEKTANPNRQPDSIINKNILAIKNPAKKAGIMKEAKKVDTSMLGYWLKQQALPKWLDKFDAAVVRSDTLVHAYNKDLKYLNYNSSLCVMYRNERESTAYVDSGHWILRPLSIPDYQLSVAKLTDGPVRFYENGGILDARSLLYQGFWAYEKVADMVPMDYIPLRKN